MVAMQDANGNLNTQAWLAGAPPVTADMLVFERHADGGIKTYGFDVFGNKRTGFDELAISRTMSAADAVRRTEYTYDAENRLTRIDRPMRIVIGDRPRLILQNVDSHLRKNEKP